MVGQDGRMPDVHEPRLRRRADPESPGRAAASDIGAPADLMTFVWGPGDTTLDVRTVVAAGRTVLER